MFALPEAKDFVRLAAVWRAIPARLSGSHSAQLSGCSETGDGISQKGASWEPLQRGRGLFD